jgi:hypothetical protein
MGTGASYKPVAGAWAVYNEDGVGKPHKSRSRVRFYEQDFYSYQTVVARYFKNKAGKLYVLATNHRYSVTTNSHIRIALDAVGIAAAFRVPRISDHEDDVQFNARSLWADVTHEADEAIRNYRRPLQDSYFGNYSWPVYVRRAHENFTRYCAIVGVELPHMGLDELMAHVRSTRESKLAKFNSPAEIAKRERAHARRLANKVI